MSAKLWGGRFTKETDKLAQEHLREVQKELAEMRDQFNQMKAKWDNEKEAISKVQKLREEIDAANSQIEQAEREYDLNRAAELKYGKLHLDPAYYVVFLDGE